MDTTQEKQIEILSELVSHCNDGHDGYSDLADKTDREDLQTIFYRLAQQRRGFAEELNGEIIALGGERVTSGSGEGNLHQLWLNLKAMVTGNDTKALIETAKTGEEHVYEQYQKNITNKNIPSFLREKLVKHHSLIKGAHDQLNAFLKELDS